jgi:hypothetical protein
MDQENIALPWKVNFIKSRLPWNKKPIRPAEIGDLLCSVMLKDENLLEDANYNKIVPNRFIVELSPDNYLWNYEPLVEGLIEQWQEKLRESLVTANSRMGRKTYRFGGEVEIELRPSDELSENQARILTVIQAKKGVGGIEGVPGEKNPAAILELVDGERRWELYPGETVIGRSKGCQIFLDLPLIQEKRLVSGQHAVIRCEAGVCQIFDGSISGKPSANGTYVNSRRVSEKGVTLKNGDIIILAALESDNPQEDTPGTAVFRVKTSEQL